MWLSVSFCVYKMIRGSHPPLFYSDSAPSLDRTKESDDWSGGANWQPSAGCSSSGQSRGHVMTALSAAL